MVGLGYGYLWVWVWVAISMPTAYPKPTPMGLGTCGIANGIRSQLIVAGLEEIVGDEDVILEQNWDEITID